MVLDAVECVTSVIYGEARGLSPRSQELIAYVVLNRAKWKIEHVCKVAYAPKQFHPVKANTEEYRKIRQLSWNILTKKTKKQDSSQGALYFHNLQAKPYWTRKFTFLFELEGHRFYK